MRVIARVRPRKVFYGWWMMLAGLISSSYLHAAYAYGFSAIFNPILNTFGWTRATVAVAFSLQRAEGAVAAPVIGYLVDRYGPRPTLVIGALLIAVGFFALSVSNGLMTFYLSFLVISVGNSLGMLLPNIVALNIWFNRYRARTLAVLSSGSGFGGLALPLVVFLIEAVGWRDALRVLAIGVILVCVPTGLAIRHRPEDYGLMPDGDAPPEGGVLPRPSPALRPKKRMYTLRALRSRIFWQFSIGVALGFIMATVFVVFSIPAFESRGLTPHQAGLAVSGAVLISLLGRALSGFLGDKLDKRYVLAMGLITIFLGVLAFATPGEGLFPIVGIMVGYGIGQGLLTPVRFAMVADFFSRDAYGELSGLMNTVSTIFGVFAPVLVGRWADMTDGDYRMPFLFFGCVCLSAMPLILTLKTPEVRLGDEE